MSSPAKPEPISLDISKLRYGLALKQSHLAALLGVDSSTVSRWERGVLAPSPWHREMLRVFKVAADDRFTWSMSSYFAYYGRCGLACDSDFKLPKIPERLREILVVAAAAQAKKTQEADAKKADAKEGKKTS